MTCYEHQDGTRSSSKFKKATFSKSSRKICIPIMPNIPDKPAVGMPTPKVAPRQLQATSKTAASVKNAELVTSKPLTDAEKIMEDPSKYKFHSCLLLSNYN